MNYLNVIYPVICLLFVCHLSNAQTSAEFNDAGSYDWKTLETLKYQAGLPDPFLKADGTRVNSTEEWPEQRKYLKALLAHYQYGEMPPRPENVVVKETLSEELYDGRAIRKLYVLSMERNGRTLEFNFGIIKPAGQGPYPVIIKNDRDVPDPAGHDPQRLQLGKIGIPHQALQDALERGYIYCAYNREDLGTDVPNEYGLNRDNGVFPLYPEYDWGTIAAWAWGSSLIVDFFETVDFVDADKVVVTGHSRGGKTAFCAGIYDDRIAVTAPNSSGLGGTSSHLFDELKSAGKHNQPPQTISMHVSRHPYWFAEEYYKFAGYETQAPFDAHFGKVIIAPRGFFNAHSYQDYHANPLGAWLTFEAARKIYEWLGAESNIAMHYRTGEHAQNVIDWFALLDFCDHYFYDKSPAGSFYTTYDLDNGNPFPWARTPVNWEVPGD